MIYRHKNEKVKELTRKIYVFQLICINIPKHTKVTVKCNEKLGGKFVPR